MQMEMSAMRGKEASLQDSVALHITHLHLHLNTSGACEHNGASFLLALYAINGKRQRKKSLTRFSDRGGSLLGRQSGTMTIGHSPKGKEAWFRLMTVTKYT